MKKCFIILLICYLASPLFALAQKDETAMTVVGIDGRIELPGHLSTHTKSGKVPLAYSQHIDGLAITGSVELQEEDGYAVVTLEDQEGREYLVCETYYPMVSKPENSFSKMAQESAYLNSVVPRQLNLYICNATLHLSDIEVKNSSSKSSFSQETCDNVRKMQERELIARINASNKERQQLWFAGETSVSNMPYESRKKRFGASAPCQYGFEYYKGGVFAFPSSGLNTSQTQLYDLFDPHPIVDEFDWRERHGKTFWNTQVKNQGPTRTCWAFSANAAIESYLNIYFNRQLDYDLSEQNLVSCIDNDNLTIHKRYANGGHSGYALQYAIDYGVIDEQSFPLQGEIPCSYNSYQELVTISSFSIIPSTQSSLTDYQALSQLDKFEMRKAIIQAPIVVGYIGGLINHAVSCVGFHKLKLGDSFKDSDTGITYHITSPSGYYGRCYWIIKNSWGEDWGEHGYGNIILESSRICAYKITGPISCNNYSARDRLATDEDHDGYYVWGCGSKPLSLPAWVPDLQDGDDSDSSIGEMDEYGFCDTLYNQRVSLWNINYPFVLDHFEEEPCYNININDGGALLVWNNSLLMGRNSTITVKNGGRLIVANAMIDNANIIVEPGGGLLVDGGIIKLRQDGKCIAQEGAILNIVEGGIRY